MKHDWKTQHKIHVAAYKRFGVRCPSTFDNGHYYVEVEVGENSFHLYRAVEQDGKIGFERVR